jgi:large subunit ribosomal protein L6
MSNIGKESIKIPQNVKVTIEKKFIIVEGPLGKLKKIFPDNIMFVPLLDKIHFFPDALYPENYANWGTARAMVNNMVLGVSQGFKTQLQLVGIGYKCFKNDNVLTFKLGYSHVKEFKIPSGISVNLIKPTLLSIHGIDLEFVTQVAAILRSYREPEPYKGKGIKYTNEIIIKKEGKKK